MANPRRKTQARRIGVSEFKAKCLRIIDHLDKQGGSVVITKHGRDVAELRTIRPRPFKSMFGSLRGKLKIKGDIVHFDTTELWEALK